MNAVRLILRTFVLCLGIPLASRGEHLLGVLPENPAVVISAADLKRIRELPEHKVATLIATPQMRKAFAPLLTRLEQGIAELQGNWKKETGMEASEVMAMFSGGASLGIAFSKMDSLKSFAPPTFTEEDTEGVIAVQFLGDETVATKVVEAFLKSSQAKDEEEPEEDDEDTNVGSRKKEESLKFPEDYTEEVEEDDGVKLHVWLPKKQAGTSSAQAWALVDKVLLLTNGERTLRAAIERVRRGTGVEAKDDPSSPLGRVKSAEAFAYFRLRPWVGHALDGAAERMNQRGQPGAPDLHRLFRWLGVEKSEALYITADFRNATIDLEAGLAFSERTGLQKFVPTSGPGVAPEFLPPDATTASYGTLSLGGFMDTLEEFAAEVSPPMRAMVMTKLDDIRRQSGVDIRKDLLGNLGAEYWSVAGDPVAALADQLKEEREDAEVAPEPQVLGFRVRDRRALELAIASILNWALPGQSLFEKQEYQGFEFHQLKAPTVPVIYLITDDWFMLSVGPRVMLEKVLSRLKKGGGGDHLFGQPHVVAAVRALPEGGDGTTYYDIGALLKSFVALIREVPAGETFFEDILDTEALPEGLEFPVAFASRLYNEERAIRLRFHIEEKARQ